MKRAVVVLLLLIANAIVSTSKDNATRQRVSRDPASSLNHGTRAFAGVTVAGASHSEANSEAAVGAARTFPPAVGFPALPL